MPEPPGSFFGEDEQSGVGNQTSSGKSDIANASLGSAIPTIKPLEFSFSGTEQPAAPRVKRKYTRRNAGGGDSSTGAETQKTVPNLTASIEEAIWTACLMGANMAHAPEFEITREEAKQIDVAVKNVAKFYDQTFDPKKVAWFQLCTVLGGTFYPRAIEYRNRKRKEGKPNVVPISGQQKAAPQNAAPKPNGVAQTPQPAKTADGQIDLSPSSVFGFEPPGGMENGE